VLPDVDGGVHSVKMQKQHFSSLFEPPKAAWRITNNRKNFMAAQKWGL